MSIWRARVPEEGSGSPTLFRCLAERILAHGEPLLAYDVITAGLATWPGDVRLRQLQGLALARSGATERANAILEDLRRDAQTGEETLGMLGRTYKDLAAAAATRDQREAFLRRAAETYGEAYRATGGYWTGINAATMNLLIGEKEHACEIASKVREQCLKEVQDPAGDQYWELAALGEAAAGAGGRAPLRGSELRELLRPAGLFADAAPLGGSRHEYSAYTPRLSNCPIPSGEAAG